MTIDCARSALKSGNAIVLRGSSYAERSNGALAALVREAVADAGLPEGAVELLARRPRGARSELATAEGLVDLVIPRGGEGLKEALKAVATVPVMYAAAGNCHVYVHADADLEMARRIAFNAKVDRPGVCNAAETLLVNAAVAAEFLPGDRGRAGRRRGRAGRRRAGTRRGGRRPRSARRRDADWDTEYLGPEDGGRRRRLARRGDRSRQRARDRALRGDRDRAREDGGRVHRRRRRGGAST